MTTRLFFAELSFQFDDQKIIAILNQKGLEYESIKLLHRGGFSLGHGFITAKTPSDAKAIIEYLNGLEVGNRKLKCEYARDTLEMKVESKQKLLSDPSAGSYSQRKEHKTLVKNTLYIANLPTNVTEDDILQLFKPYSPKNVRIVTDNDDVSRGFGFIEFENEENSLTALEDLKGVLINDSPITLRLARKQRDVATSSETTLFIARLPLTLSESDLNEVFAAFNPKKCHFIKNRDTTSTFGYAFIVFGTPQDCKNAFEYTQHPNFAIGGSKVVVEYALS